MSEIENAVIESTMLGTEDHGLFSLMLTMESVSGSQGFGGYRLDRWNEVLKRGVGTAFGCEIILRILNTVGATSWESLKGKHCRVRRERPFGPICAIGHIIKDKWFDIEQTAKEFP